MNWIQRGLLVMWGLGFCLPAVATSLMQNPNSLKNLDVELPFRCSSASVDEGEAIASSVALSNLDFTVRLSGQTDLLPRYQVNGFTFSNKTVDVAVADLIKEAGIMVIAEKGEYPTLSARDLKGELSAVLEELLRQGNLFYVYQADKKTLFLNHKVKAQVQIPHNRFVMMAVLDALNGRHLEPFSIDWDKFQISLTLTRSELQDLQNLMASMTKEKYILAVQVKLYDLTIQNSKGHWQNIMNRLGLKGLSVLQNGLVGQALTLPVSTDEGRFFDAIRGTFDLKFVGAGKVVVPSGWRTRFNFNQCFQHMFYPDLSLFLKTSVKKKNEAQTILTLNSSLGEVASFDVTNNLDQKIMLIGIPVPNKSNKELMLSLQFQFIQLIKKGEQEND